MNSMQRGEKKEGQMLPCKKEGKKGKTSERRDI